MPGMRAIPLTEVFEILNGLSVKYAALAAVGVTTGCRISELLQLRRSDLISPYGELKERIKFVKLKTKSENPQFRQLIVPADFQGYIKKHLHEDAQRGFERADDWVFRGIKRRHLTRQSCYRVFRIYLGQGYGTHWMRKTFAQEIYKFFLSENFHDSLRAIELTRQALGHSQIDTTIKYLGINYELLDRAQTSIFSRERIINGR